jgi:hypothetical protein
MERKRERVREVERERERKGWVGGRGGERERDLISLTNHNEYTARHTFEVAEVYVSIRQYTPAYVTYSCIQ